MIKFIFQLVNIVAENLIFNYLIYLSTNMYCEYHYERKIYNLLWYSEKIKLLFLFTNFSLTSKGVVWRMIHIASLSLRTERGNHWLVKNLAIFKKNFKYNKFIVFFFLFFFLQYVYIFIFGKLVRLQMTD